MKVEIGLIPADTFLRKDDRTGIVDEDRDDDDDKKPRQQDHG